MTHVDQAPPLPHLQYQQQPDYPPVNSRGAPYSQQRPMPTHQNSTGGWSSTREKMMRRRVRISVLYRQYCVSTTHADRGRDYVLSSLFARSSFSRETLYWTCQCPQVLSQGERLRKNLHIFDTPRALSILMNSLRRNIPSAPSYTVEKLSSLL